MYAVRFSRQRLPLNLGIHFVPQQEGWVVQRFGKYKEVLEPGLRFLIPFVDRVAYRHSLKMVTLEIPNQVGITKDNVNIEIDGILYYRIVDPIKASYNIDDPEFAIQQLAMSTMRVEVGKLDLEKIFEERELMNRAIVDEINNGVAQWGLHCDRYEIRDIKPPVKAMRAMELQMIAERRRRQKVIRSEAERTAMVNRGEGQRTATILAAEAKKMERQLLAEGEANAIKVKAQATAEGLEKVAQAMHTPRASDAVSLVIAEQYVKAFGELAQKGNTLLLPTNAGDVSGMVAQALAIYQNISARSPVRPNSDHAGAGETQQHNASSGSQSKDSFDLPFIPKQ
jgi:regulator of protease activity HflC (stomatin/prohibitin superfamily)